MKAHLFLQTEVMGTYPPATGILGWGLVGAGLLAPQISLPNVHPPHRGEGQDYSSSVPLLSVWMDVVSLIPLFSDFHSTPYLMVRVLFALYVSCNLDVLVQRGAMSPSAATLTRSPETI